MNNLNSCVSKYFITVWLTLTLLLSYSIVSHLTVFALWTYYFIRGANLKKFMLVGVFGGFVVGTLLYLGYGTTFNEYVRPSFRKLTLQDAGRIDLFLEGGYSRVAAVYYYLDAPLKLLGDGPSRYFNPATKEFVLGNKGHIFTFYSEVGIIGLLFSYLILFNMARIRGAMTRVTAMPFFLMISMLSVAQNVLSDAGFMLIYNTFIYAAYIVACDVRSTQVFNESRRRII